MTGARASLPARRGFHGVKLRRSQIAKRFFVLRTQQAGMPALQSVDDIYGNSSIKIMC